MFSEYLNKYLGSRVRLQISYFDAIFKADAEPASDFF